MTEQIIIFFQIVFIDLVLAGDNAIIIGMVASQFADDQRKKIIFWGIGAAIVLRIIFTLITAYLLQINGLRLVGGILLLYIVYKLYKDVIKNGNDNKNNIQYPPYSIDEIDEFTNTSNIKSAPPTSNAPSYNSMTQDVCALGVSAGIQTFGIGVSGGKHVIDKNCERLKLARILNDFGMKVAAVAILCQDERVFESMIQAGTPCPIDGKIGSEAMGLWKLYDFERPDYKKYVSRMKKREEVNPVVTLPSDKSTDKKVKWKEPK